MPKYATVQSALFGFLCTLFLVVTAAADSPKQPVNIPPGDLSTALNALAKQSGTDLVYRPEQVKGLKTQGVSGNLSVEDALAKLLAGTPLTVNKDSTGALLISTPKPHATAAPSNPATGSVTPANSEVRVAQAQTSAASANQAVPERAEESKKAKDEGLSEIVVTGTLLHDVAPITPITTITQSDIVNQGYSTLAEVIAQLPQNYQGAGTSPSSNALTGFGGNGAIYNSTYASGINLRGLGGSATLVLLNGRRLAPTALGGTVDISQIPVSIIDRVEILTDGASALYGSDAVAGVVNSKRPTGNWLGGIPIC